uniref:Uncharacterized protein n=1 Tax=Amphimedon queenslandica TaxID=400682 RepID=A0A1X7TAD3_AMPQE
MDQLILISSYVIKDEACREDKINGIETKFYALEKFDLIASSFIFRAPLRGGKMALFAFYVTLPYKELAEFMPRYSLCEDKIRSILKKQIINKMEEKKYERPVKGLIGEQVEEFLCDFSHKLQGLSQVMLSVRYESIPLDILVDDTILGFENSKLKGWIDFLSEAITCHLQIGGHTVIFGEDKDIIMKVPLFVVVLFIVVVVVYRC